MAGAQRCKDIWLRGSRTDQVCPLAADRIKGRGVSSGEIGREFVSRWQHREDRGLMSQRLLQRTRNPSKFLWAAGGQRWVGTGWWQ